MGQISVLPDFQPPPRVRETRMIEGSPPLEHLLLRREDGRDRSVPPDQVLNHAILHHGPAGVGQAAVRQYQRIAAAIDDQVTVARQLEVTGVFPKERDRHNRAALERPALPMRQLDDRLKAQLAQIGWMIEIERPAI